MGLPASGWARGAYRYAPLGTPGRERESHISPSGLWLRFAVGGDADDGFLPLRGGCGCAAAEWGSDPTRRAGGGWPDPPPAPPAGPIEQRHQCLLPVPVRLADRSTVHPCTGLALANILRARPISCRLDLPAAPGLVLAARRSGRCSNGVEKASAMLRRWSYCSGGVLMAGIPSTSVQGGIYSVPDRAIAQALPDDSRSLLESRHSHLWLWFCLSCGLQLAATPITVLAGFRARTTGNFLCAAKEIPAKKGRP